MAANINLQSIIENQKQDLTKPLSAMSIYSELSKEIGFENEPVRIPHPDVAKELLHLVREEKNEAAFKQVFLIYRFGPVASNETDREAINIICEAFNAGSIIFK